MLRDGLCVQPVREAVPHLSRAQVAQARPLNCFIEPDLGLSKKMEPPNGLEKIPYGDTCVQYPEHPIFVKEFL